MSNVQKLEHFLRGCTVGQRLEIATSKHAYNGVEGFDFHSTAQAVRSAINKGWLVGSNRRRYYEVTVNKLPEVKGDDEETAKRLTPQVADDDPVTLRRLAKAVAGFNKELETAGVYYRYELRYLEPSDKTRVRVLRSRLSCPGGKRTGGESDALTVAAGFAHNCEQTARLWFYRELAEHQARIIDQLREEHPETVRLARLRAGALMRDAPRMI